MIQAYNYMLESYPVNREIRYPANKRSELRKVYNDIVSLSKRLPLYKINLSKENQAYSFGIKETALTLKAKIEEMSDLKISGFQDKTVSVSDESVLTAELLSSDTSALPELIQFKVKALATAQVNRGKELLMTSHALPKGEYPFQASVMDETYSLTYIQQERTENSETLKNMARFLNQSVPGITASIEKGESKDYIRLVIVADSTGKFGERSFSFEDGEVYREGVVDFFGLDRMDSAPSHANFELNGVDKQTASNMFHLESTLQISLHSIREGEEPVNLRIVPDSDKILSAVDSVMSTYNHLIHLAKARMIDNKEHFRAAKLLKEMSNLTSMYKEELEACGLKPSEDGFIQREESLSIQASEDGGMESLFKRENGFIARLLDKAESIAINPMEYLDKTIVTYPNTEKNSYHNPYVTSIYSGLFFSSYC